MRFTRTTGVALVATATACTASLWSPVTVPNADRPHGRTGSVMGQMGEKLVVFGGCTSSCCYAPEDAVYSLNAKNPTTWMNETINGDAPSARVFSQLVNAGPQEAWLFGGSNVVDGFMNDLWTLGELADGELAWTQVEASNPGGAGLPPQRAGHSMTLLHDERTLFVFGGTNDYKTLSDTWLYDTKLGSWQKVNITTAPPARTHAGVAEVVVGGTPWVVLFAGTDQDGKDLNDVWVFNQISYEWVQVGSVTDPTGPLPPGVHGVAMFPTTPSSETVYVFGGEEGVGESNPFSPYTWTLTIAASDGGVDGTLAVVDKGVSAFNTSTTQPNARSCAAQTLFVDTSTSNAAGESAGDTKPVLFGGFSGYYGGLKDELHNDLFVLNIPAEAAL